MHRPNPLPGPRLRSSLRVCGCAGLRAVGAAGASVAGARKRGGGATSGDESGGRLSAPGRAEERDIVVCLLVATGLHIPTQFLPVLLPRALSGLFTVQAL